MIMNLTIAHRFDTEFAPRIAQGIVDTLGDKIDVVLTAYRDPDHPTTVTITGLRRERPSRHLAHSLNVRLTWDAAEIADLVGDQAPLRFARYLRALPAKLAAWQDAREIDFISRCQAEPAVLIGNLDFEA